MRFDQILGRNFDAEIDDVIAVVFQDNFDEILPDVVNVALHRGENHLGALFRVGLFHELFEMVHGGLHGFGGLQHFGDDQFIGIEQAAHFGHSGHQRTVDDFERRDTFLALAIEVVDQSVFRAFENVIRQALVERQIGSDLLLAAASAAEMLGNRRDVELVDGGFLFLALLAPVGGQAAKQRGIRMIGRNVFRRRVEQEIFGELAFVLGNRRQSARCARH